MLEMYSPFLGKSGDELNLLRARGGFKRVFDFALRVRLLLLTTRGTPLGLVRRRRNRHRGAGARNIGSRVAGLLTNYLIPILLPADVFLNLNRMLVTIDIAFLLRNLTRVPRLSGWLWRRRSRGRGFSLNRRLSWFL